MGCCGSVEKPSEKTQETPDEPKRTPERKESELEQGPEADVIKFCSMMKKSFVPQSVWIGSMNVRENASYLEWSVINNENKTDVEIRRIIDLDATLDHKRFAQFKELSIKPVKRKKNDWIAELSYEDYDKTSGMTVKMIANEMHPKKNSVTGTCTLTKDGVVRNGVWSIVRIMAPRTADGNALPKGETDPRLSKLILKYTQNTDQALSDQALELFGRESTKSMSDTIEYTKCERVQKVKRAMTKRWIEYHSTSTDLGLPDMMLSDDEFLDTMLKSDMEDGDGGIGVMSYHLSEDNLASPQSPYVFEQVSY